MPWAAAAGAAASIAGSAISSSLQGGAASSASNSQMAMYNQMRSDLMPYMNTGGLANTAISNATGLGTSNPLTSALLGAPTANLSNAQVAQTPGYQFALQQGLESTQNGFAAQGLGSSGAALKGAANYATGLAENTYQQQYQNQVTNQTNQFNRLMGLTQLGQNSAAGVGAAGIQTGQGIASNTIGAGNAAGAAAVSAGNAAGGAYGNSLLYNYLGNAMGSSGSGSAYPSSGGTAPTGALGQVFSTSP